MAKYQLSKQDIIKEVFKCGKDPLYFINNYVKTTHPIRGLIPLDLYDYQETLIKDYNDHRFNIILKGRQLGISTITAAYCLWMIMFHREKNIMVIATKFETAANLVRKVKSMMRYLPDWIRITTISVDNRTAFELTNGSIIKASATSEDAGRSEALSLLVIDEAAHVSGLEDLWKAIAPTLATGGRCIGLSSPNGAGNWFHQQFMMASEEKNDFHPTTLMWDVHPERDQAWFDKETKGMSQRDIAQEHLCNFNMSGETVFDPKDLTRISEGLKEPIHKTGFDRNLWIWEEFQNNASYLLTADVARGDGKDYSTLHIIKLETMEIVAEYQGKIAPDLYADLLYSIGGEYGNCMIVVENNTIGYAVLDKLVEKQYPNIYFSIKSTHEYIEQYQAEHKNNTVAGFTTSSKTRPLVIAKMEEFVRNELITIYSSRIYNEMRTFVWNNSKPEAMRGYNDDLIMACAIGCWVKETALTENTRDLKYKKAFLSACSSTRTVLDTRMPGRGGPSNQEGLAEALRQAKLFSWVYRG